MNGALALAVIATAALADLARKSGDDFAARVYVFFDVPRDELPFGTRFKLKMLEILYGERLPTAAICYVWDNRHPVGTSRWNPYSDQTGETVTAWFGDFRLEPRR